MATVSIGEWAKQTQERIDAVHKRSVELLAEEMIRTKPNGGRLPVDTGNLARSQLASQTAMPKTSEGPFNGSNVGAVVATMDVTKPTWLGYTAVYSRRRNYGFVGADSLGRVYNEQGDYFVEGAIAQWPQIVAAAVADVKANAKS
jgi:hypothetical protein